MVLMDMIYELLINKPTPTEVTEIQNNTIRKFQSFKLTLKPDCCATMDNGDK